MFRPSQVYLHAAICAANLAAPDDWPRLPPAAAARLPPACSALCDALRHALAGRGAFGTTSTDWEVAELARGATRAAGGCAAARKRLAEAGAARLLARC